MAEEKKDDVYGDEENNIPESVLEVLGNDYGTGNDDELENSDLNPDGDVEDIQDGSDVGEDGVSEVAEDAEETPDTEESDEDVEDGGTEQDEETEPVPVEHVRLGERLGWPDDKIVKLSEEYPDVLDEMARLAGRQTQQPQVEQKVAPAATQKQEAEAKGIDKVNLDEEALGKLRESYGDEVVKEVISPLVKGLNTTIDQLNTLRSQVDSVEQSNLSQQAKQNFEEANAVFDNLAETFSVFGKTENLPRTATGEFDVNSPAVQERGQVYEVAQAFHAAGRPWSDSLKQAVRWYKGEHAEKALERKIIKDLNSRKKKFSPRPTNKKTVRSFKSREDEGVELVRKALKK